MKTYTCHTCGLPVDPNNCWYRYGYYFHSPECRDLFDERNDYGHLNDRDVDLEDEEDDSINY